MNYTVMSMDNTTTVYVHEQYGYVHEQYGYVHGQYNYSVCP